MKRTLKLVESDNREERWKKFCNSVAKKGFLNIENMEALSDNDFIDKLSFDELDMFNNELDMYSYQEIQDMVKKELAKNEENIFGQETPDEKKAKEDSAERGLYPKDELTEDVDTGKDEENDTAEEIADDMQDETPAEEEEKSGVLDAELEDLREILPDLDLNLYQVTDKEDTNKIFYFIGKVAEDSNDVLMLVDNNPTDDIDEPSTINDELPEDEDNKEIDELEDTETNNDEVKDESEDNRFDFVKIPDKYEDLAKLAPRYGDELNPDHDAIMEYLMKCLVEKDPKRAEELSSEKDIDDGDNTKIPLDADIQADIDNKIEHYSNNLNK